MTTKHIYLLTNIDDSSAVYDVFEGHVVVAESEEEARSLCSCSDECDKNNNNHNCFWQNPLKVSCKRIGTWEGEEYFEDFKGAILSDFHAG